MFRIEYIGGFISSRLRQENEESNAEPESLTLVIDQPKVCELYYNYCAMVSRRRILNALVSSPLIKNDGSVRCGLSVHLASTKRKRIDVKGKVSSNALQGRCNMYTYKTAWCCSKCEDDHDLEINFLCNPKSKSTPCCTRQKISFFNTPIIKHHIDNILVFI